MKTRSSVAFLLVVLCWASMARGQTLEWIRQFGTAQDDTGDGVSADGVGNVYITGKLDNNAFVSKYDTSGMLQWTQQFAGFGSGVSADGMGNVYISGSVNAGQPTGKDAFLAKYDASGTQQWIRELSSSDNGDVSSKGVSTDGQGNVYIAGFTTGSLGSPVDGGYDAFLSKYDASGLHQWTRQFGTSVSDWAWAVSADVLGNVFVGGHAGSSPFDNDNDAFLYNYDANGSVQWIRQYGSAYRDHSHAVSADGLGNVYTAGITDHDPTGDSYAIVTKYDASGTHRWTREFEGYGFGVSTDGSGQVYVTGWDNRPGTPTQSDAFLGKYDESGTLEWIRWLGTPARDIGKGVAMDGLGAVYISGRTTGSLAGPNVGGNDAFLAKFWADLPALNADFDLDGDVDGDDFLRWQSGFPMDAFRATKSDGDVDGDDFLGWQGEFGASGGGAAASRVIPEPSCAILWLVAFVCSLSCRRRIWHGGIVMRYLLLAAATLALSSPTAHAIVVSDYVGSHTTTPGIPAFGVNIDGVIHLVMDDGSPLASGALISDRHVLTVAQAVDLDLDFTIDPHVIDELQVVFSLPGGSQTLGVAAAAVPDEWSNLPPIEALTYNIAVLTLAADAPAAAPRYPLYGGRQEVGQRVVVTGYGMTGHGSVGMEVRSADLLAGLNRYEVDSAEFFLDLETPSMLLYDFDSGLAENNALEFLGIPSGLGFGDDEVGSATGDSGGPVFLGGAIAGINFFGFGSLASNPFPPDVTSVTDSSWGEVFIDTRASYYREFLTTATDGQAVFVIPEPTSLWLMVAIACGLPWHRRACVRRACHQATDCEKDGRGPVPA